MTARSLEIRVLLAYEQSMVREAVKIVVANEDDLIVVGEACNSEEAVAEAGRLQPDITLLGADFQNGEAIRAVRRINREAPHCRVIVTSAQEDEHVLLQAIEAGARGYLPQGSPLIDLIAATRAVHRGEALVPSTMLAALLRRLIRRRRERDEVLRRMSGLTQREREVLAILAEGANDDAIAHRLVISRETARTHVQNIRGKLGAHTRLEAAAFVTQNGIQDDLVAVAR